MGIFPFAFKFKTVRSSLVVLLSFSIEPFPFLCIIRLKVCICVHCAYVCTVCVCVYACVCTAHPKFITLRFKRRMILVCCCRVHSRQSHFISFRGEWVRMCWVCVCVCVWLPLTARPKFAVSSSNVEYVCMYINAKPLCVCYSLPIRNRIAKRKFDLETAGQKFQHPYTHKHPLIYENFI